MPKMTGPGKLILPPGYTPPKNPQPIVKAPSPGGVHEQGTAPPPPPTAQAQPPDHILTAQQAAINRRRDDTLAFLGQEETRVGQDFGLTDTSNPFSRAALLQRAYDQQQRGNVNSYAARGQLYSGALQNMRNETQFGFQRDQDFLQRDFGQVMADIQRRRALAQSGAEEDLIGARNDSLSRSLANRPDPSTVFQAPLSDEGGKSYLPEGYDTWSLARKRKYWAQRRKEKNR